MIRLSSANRLVSATLLLASLLLYRSVSSAQITLDGSLRAGAPRGALGTVTGTVGAPNFVIPASVGELRGNNLFHSFGQFNVNTGQTATFTPTGLTIPATNVANILSRVTGGQRSFIDGEINSRAMPNANFFFLNPSGVLFGANATLQIGGAFHVSTADYLRFEDASGTPGGKFSANSSALSANGLATDPVAFGFLRPAPIRIVIEGSQFEVDSGKTISVVGGEAPFPVPGEIETGLKIAGGSLSAPAGRIQIVSVGSPSVGTAGEVALTQNLPVSSFASLGEMNISASTIGASGGTVAIRGGAITIAATSNVDASGDPAGTVEIFGRRLVVSDISTIQANTGEIDGAPFAVDLNVTDEIRLESGSNVLALGSGAGTTGDIRIATNHLQIEGFSGVGTLGSGTGQTGRIDAKVGTMTVTDGAIVLSQTSGGAAKDIKLVGDSILLSAGGNISSQTLSSVPEGTGAKVSISGGSLTITDGSKVETLGGDTAAGGKIIVAVDNLVLTGGGIVNSTTGLAPGGDLLITASKSAKIAGPGSGIFSVGTGGVLTPAGNIDLTVGQLTVTQEGTIQNGDLFNRGGSITIAASDSILVSERGKIFSQAFHEPVGNVVISAPKATVTIDNGLVAASTSEDARAGDISLTANNINLINGGQIVTSSTAGASGRGGDLTVNATGSIVISGHSTTGPVSSFVSDLRSGLFSAASQSGSGPGGNIKATAGEIHLLDEGTISANSTGTASALAGNVNIVTNTLTMNNGSITTESLRAEGGNISITTTGSQLYLLDSQITTSVKSDVGSGGNITLGSQAHPFDFIILNGSQIRADAFGGSGGNIGIFADTFLTSESLVSASSALSTPGTINVQARFTNLSGNIAQLPETVVQAAALLRAACAARLSAGKISSLVVAGREGVPLEPGGVMPSPLIAESLTDLGPLRSEGHEWEPLSGAWQVSLRSKCSM